MAFSRAAAFDYLHRAHKQNRLAHAYLITGPRGSGKEQLAADLARQTIGPVSYVCGGVGEDEQQALKSETKDFDMGLLFTEGARGEYLSDVAITLSRNGVEVASFRSNGPRCLIKAPRATYQVVATYNGVDKHTTLRMGERNVQLNW